MQVSSLQTSVPSENLSEVKLPVLGVVMVINEVICPSCNDNCGFLLTVSDLDSGTVFKELNSCDLDALMKRQHQLMLGFAE